MPPIELQTTLYGADNKICVCYSCGTACDPDWDLCSGCGKIVCVKCSLSGFHFMGGAHTRVGKPFRKRNVHRLGCSESDRSDIA